MLAIKSKSISIALLVSSALLMQAQQASAYDRVKLLKSFFSIVMIKGYT
ncbi:MAG: hypothetical protein RL593_795, partial [Pseudomonadota bacterium]